MTSSNVTIAVAGVLISLGVAAAAVHAQTQGPAHEAAKAELTSGPAPQKLQLVERTVWQGADLDGDGQTDIADPTGQAPRGDDRYGEGRFHAGRDGGRRRHEGVDYVSTPGQPVEAPISGYVAKIGFAYKNEATLRYVEIENPALHMSARVFYVNPDVAVGDTVAVGHPIGHAQSLAQRYRGITNHVHLELADGRGHKLDAETLITAQLETGVVAAD
jgi:murein DD-endopeptidase MepM/ murein hydrolase activator NlpD